MLDKSAERSLTTLLDLFSTGPHFLSLALSDFGGEVGLTLSFSNISTMYPELQEKRDGYFKVAEWHLFQVLTLYGAFSFYSIACLVYKKNVAPTYP